MKTTGWMMVFIFALLTACSNAPQKTMDKKEILEKGSALFVNNGCAVCHSLEGKVIYGPPLNDLFMKEVKVVRQGEEITLTADRDYLKRAIIEPRSEKVLEYQNKDMPIPLFTDKEAEILVEYIIALSGSNE